ncbi:MAG TPA: AAA family ATPase [Vicinamibacterales bacterium]|nr:AAA family ATPase [Vicinamibacterales bacterium]
MITDDQAAVIDFLSAPSTHGGLMVDRIETHTALVFLAGTRAWKLKRAVRFDYLDFSTTVRRKAMCEAEVRLNRRTAPSVYRGVVPITRQADGSLALNGPGTPVEWVIEMERFDQEALFDRLAGSGRLGLELMTPLAATIAEFHRAAEHHRDRGGKVAMISIIQGIADGLREYGAGLLDPFACDRWTSAASAEADQRGSLLDDRREKGHVRQCHGDLHLRNIVLLDGQPTLFDAIEFNDGLACIDVLYDLAFLLMDLWRRDLPRHANALWNDYLTATHDLDGVALMPLFLSCRAAVRAMTSATASRVQSDPARIEESRRMAREYLAMAERLLQTPRPSLIAVGGLSGSGKSVLAMSLAPTLGAVPGAVVLRSDEIRKEVCGVPRLQHLGPDGYTPEISQRVYLTLAERARQAIRGGYGVVADAVFARRADREAIQRIAFDLSVPFTGVWLDASYATLIERIQSRHTDPSDADEAVVRRQRDQDPGVIDWHHVDASRPADAVLRTVAAFNP